MQQLSTRVGSVFAQFRQLLEADAAMAEAAVASADASAADDVARAELAAARSAQERHQYLLRELAASTEQWAPGAAGRDWSGDWKQEEARIGSAFRIGTVRVGSADVAALLPFFSTPGWFLPAGVPSEDLLRAVLLRAVAQIPLKHFALDVFDPRGRGSLGGFSRLRPAAAHTFPTPSVDPHQFGDRLQAATDEAARSAEQVVQHGASDLLQWWEQSDVPAGIQRVVVLLDYPFGVDQTLQQRLLRMARSHSPAQPALVVLHDPTVQPEPDVDPEELRRCLLDHSSSGGAWQLGTLPVIPDPAPPTALVNEVIDSALERSRSVRGPVVPLREALGDDTANPWLHSAAEGLDVVFGRSGSEPLELSLC